MEISARKVLTRITLILGLLVATVSVGQNVTVINQYSGGKGELAPEGYVLKNVTEQTYIINEYEPSNTGQRSLLDQMITYGLKSYIDNQYHPFDGRVEAIASQTDFADAGSALVKNAIWIHDLPFSELFEGFSPEVVAQAARIKQLDGYEILTGNLEMREPANNKIGLYTFQRLVFNLKEAAIGEARTFLDKYLPQTIDRGYDESDEQFLQSENYVLNPIENSDSELRNLQPDESLILSAKGRDKKKKRGKNDDSLFSQRIVELLEENNKILANYSSRFEDLQNQIDRLREDSPGRDVREEMAELRSMIRDLAENRSTIRPTSSSVAVTVTFEKNEYQLTAAQKARLNQVKTVLTRNPAWKAMVTGYADKSGDPNFNAWISQQRAEAVKTYLVAAGISSSRLVMNYLGDIESESENAQDRRVEVTYLEN